MQRVPKGKDDPVQNIVGVAKVLTFVAISTAVLGAAAIGLVFGLMAICAYLLSQYLRGRQGS